MKLGQFKRRWTLGGLMILIAVLALPLAIYVHREREEARRRAETVNYIKRLVGELNERLEYQAVGTRSPAVGGVTPR